MPSNVCITLELIITLKKVRRFKETEKKETGLPQSPVSVPFKHMKFIITSLKKKKYLSSYVLSPIVCAEITVVKN